MKPLERVEYGGELSEGSWLPRMLEWRELLPIPAGSLVRMEACRLGDIPPEAVADEPDEVEDAPESGLQNPQVLAHRSFAVYG